MKKRPNPAVDSSAKFASLTEDMSKLADATMPAVSSLPAALKASAKRKRAGANRIKKEHPFLISNED